ncbi:MAG: hypothetical protein K9M57_06800 [Phycisphaerae bacterium]|nr:hypothetical protein [Phycisphaerae bacterium]
MRYVEANPLRAKMVTAAADWPWSSMGRRDDPARPFELSPGPVAMPENWVDIVERPFNDQETADFTNCIKRGCPYGQKNWVMKIAEDLNLESTLNKRGRPKIYPESYKLT